MAAFNYLLFDFVCPGCAQRSPARPQICVAADHAGRFMNREYQLGERMVWFPPEEAEPEDWIGFCEPSETGVYVEESEVVCPHCEASLSIAIEYQDRIAIRVVDRARGTVLAAPEASEDA